MRSSTVVTLCAAANLILVAAAARSAEELRAGSSDPAAVTYRSQMLDGGAALNSGDYARALAVLRPLADHPEAAERDDIVAVQLLLGQIYGEGLGVFLDDEEAIAWYRRAATRDEPVAWFMLGDMYQSGRGVPQDDVVAFYWFAEASKAGSAMADYRVALSYYMGLGRPIVPYFAVNFARDAANHGIPAAAYLTGMLILKGFGEPRDAIDGLKWLFLAKTNSGLMSTDDAKNLFALIDDTIGQMSASDVSEAQARADAWRPPWWSGD